MKYIDAEKLKAEIEKNTPDTLQLLVYRDIILSLIDSLQQEQPKEICHNCIHYGKDDDYCYNPHGGMQSLINENGVYECTGFCEKEQEQPSEELEKEISRYLRTECAVDDEPSIPEIARSSLSSRPSP